MEGASGTIVIDDVLLFVNRDMDLGFEVYLHSLHEGGINGHLGGVGTLSVAVEEQDGLRGAITELDGVVLE